MFDTSRKNKIEKKKKVKRGSSILHLRRTYVNSGKWPEQWSPDRSKYGVLQPVFSALSDGGGFLF